MATTSLEIPIQSLLELPEGASYHQKTGRLALKARRKGSKLLIEGESDSLGRSVNLLRKYTENVQQRADSSKVAAKHEEQKEKITRSRVPPWLIPVLGGIALLIALLILIYRYKTIFFKR